MKILKILFGSCLVLAFAACSSSDSEYHYFNMASPARPIYGDQIIDTLGIESTDSWTATTDATWFSLQYPSYTVEEGKFSYAKDPMTITKITDGTARGNYLIIKSNGHTYHESIIQVPWLNITNPYPTFTGLEGGINNITSITDFSKLKATFALTESKSAACNDSIMFTLFDTSATISTTDSWITLAKTSVTHNNNQKSQSFTVRLTLTENTTGADRTGNVTIKSNNGTSSVVTVQQPK